MGEYNIFISYGRADTDFVDRITAALKAHGYIAWVDTEYLKPSQRFWEKIDAAIDQAVAFLAVISPDSAGSAQCAREIQRALESRQKLVPILCREVAWDDDSVSAAVTRLRDNIEFISFLPPVEFDDRLDLLIRTLDNEWEEAETSAALRALAVNWDKHSRSDGSTLNADQLRRFQDWVASGIGNKFELTDLQREFLLASQRKAEKDRKALQDALALSRKHEREALKRESLLIASQSRQQTAAGRPDLGAKLALLALPRSVDEPDRPLVTGAESALFAAMAQSRFSLEIGGGDQKLCVAGISPNGERAFLSFNAIGGLLTQLWDLSSGEHMKTIGDTTYMFRHAAFSRDGRFLAVGYVSGAGILVDMSGRPLGNLIQIVDARSGDPVTKFRVPGQESTYVRFSPNSRNLLIATDEGLMLMDTDNWELQRGESAIKGVTLACFSDDESKLAFATRDGQGGVVLRGNRAMRWLGFKSVRWLYDSGKLATVGLQLTGTSGDTLVAAVGSSLHWIDPRKADHRGSFTMHKAAKVLALGRSREQETIVAITEDGRAHSWREEEERIAVDAADGSPVVLRSASISEPGTGAVVEFANGAIEFWDLGSVERIVLLDAAQCTVVHAGFDDSGLRVLIVTSDNIARVWDRGVAQGASIIVTDPARKATAIAMHPRVSHIAIGYADKSIELRSLSDRALIWRADAAHESDIVHIAFDATGTRLVTSSEDCTAAIWSVEDGQAEFQLSGHAKRVNFADFSRDGTRLVTASSDSTARIWDANNATSLCELPLPEEYRDPIHNASIKHQAVFTSDGKRVVTVSAGDGMNVHQPALVWDVQSGSLLQALKHEGGIWHVSLTQDDRFVITSSYDKSIRMWDVTSGERYRTFSGHAGIVFKAIAYADGHLLVSASADGTARIWRVDSASVVHVLQGHSGPVAALAVSADDRLVATGGADSAVRLWDASIGDLMHEFTALDGPVRDVVFSEDRRWLITRTKGGTVQAWPLPPLGQALIDLAWDRYVKDGGVLTREQRVRFNLEEP